MELVNTDLGPEAAVKIVIAGGKLSLVSIYDSKGVDGNVTMSVELGYFIDKLKEKIAGQVDDVILDVVKAALKSIP